MPSRRERSAPIGLCLSCGKAGCGSEIARPEKFQPIDFSLVVGVTTLQGERFRDKTPSRARILADFGQGNWRAKKKECSWRTAECWPVTSFPRRSRSHGLSRLEIQPVAAGAVRTFASIVEKGLQPPRRSGPAFIKEGAEREGPEAFADFEVEEAGRHAVPAVSGDEDERAAREDSKIRAARRASRFGEKTARLRWPFQSAVAPRADGRQADWSSCFGSREWAVKPRSVSTTGPAPPLRPSDRRSAANLSSPCARDRSPGTPSLQAWWLSDFRADKHSRYQVQHRQLAISVVRAVRLAGESRHRGGRGVRVSVHPHP